VVAPGGNVFTNDAGGVAACPTCPRVVVASTNNAFYTVVIAKRPAPQAQEASFTLRVGLYNSGNAPNCASPTPAE
jgi:hypothetical protein